MIPRWLLILLVLVAILWLLADPAGMADFFVHIGKSLLTFFQRVARWQ